MYPYVRVGPTPDHARGEQGTPIPTRAARSRGTIDQTLSSREGSADHRALARARVGGGGGD